MLEGPTNPHSGCIAEPCALQTAARAFAVDDDVHRAGCHILKVRRVIIEAQPVVVDLRGGQSASCSFKYSGSGLMVSSSKVTVVSPTREASQPTG